MFIRRKRAHLLYIRLVLSYEEIQVLRIRDQEKSLSSSSFVVSKNHHHDRKSTTARKTKMKKKERRNETSTPKNQRTSPIKVSSIDLMRAESHDRLSIANGCSRDVVLSHVSAIQKKRRELSILIDTKLPHRYSNPVSKNERLEFFPKKCSFLHVKSSLTSSSMKKREDMQ